MAYNYSNYGIPGIPPFQPWSPGATTPYNMGNVWGTPVGPDRTMTGGWPWSPNNYGDIQNAGNNEVYQGITNRYSAMFPYYNAMLGQQEAATANNQWGMEYNTNLAKLGFEMGAQQYQLGEATRQFDLGYGGQQAQMYGYGMGPSGQQENTFPYQQWLAEQQAGASAAQMQSMGALGQAMGYDRYGNPMGYRQTMQSQESDASIAYQQMQKQALQSQLTGNIWGAPTQAASEYARSLAEQQRQFNAGNQQAMWGAQGFMPQTDAYGNIARNPDGSIRWTATMAGRAQNESDTNSLMQRQVAQAGMTGYTPGGASTWERELGMGQLGLQQTQNQQAYGALMGFYPGTSTPTMAKSQQDWQQAYMAEQANRNYGTQQAQTAQGYAGLMGFYPGTTTPTMAKSQQDWQQAYMAEQANRQYGVELGGLTGFGPGGNPSMQMQNYQQQWANQNKQNEFAAAQLYGTNYEGTPTLDWQKWREDLGLQKEMEATQRNVLMGGMTGYGPGGGATLDRQAQEQAWAAQNRGLNLQQGQQEWQQAYQNEQANRDWGAQLAGLTGYYNANPTKAYEQELWQRGQTEGTNALSKWATEQQIASQNENANRQWGAQLAGVTGFYNENPTLENQQWGAANQLAQTASGRAGQQQDWTQAYQNEQAKRDWIERSAGLSGFYDFGGGGQQTLASKQFDAQMAAQKEIAAWGAFGRKFGPNSKWMG